MRNNPTCFIMDNDFGFVRPAEKLRVADCILCGVCAAVLKAPER